MEYEQGSPVPNITGTNHPYMVSLYGRIGAGEGTDPQRVLDSAEATWNQARNPGERAEATEALMGRRIDGGELSELPPELVDAIFDGADFDVAVQGVAKVLRSPKS